MIILIEFEYSIKILTEIFLGMLKTKLCSESKIGTPTTKI